MKRYIDAENAKSYIYGQFVDRFPPFTLGAIIEGMDDIETEEVAPVVHAHWRRLSDTWCKCSCCGHDMLRNEPRVYCPFCGAKMDEKEGQR